MTIGYNRPEVAQALANLLGIKGGFKSEADGVLTPSIQVAQLFDTPYLQYGTGVARAGSPTAVALKFGIAIAQPAVGVALQVNRIVVVNNGSVSQHLDMRLLTATNVAALDTLQGTAQMMAMTPLDAASPLRPSQVKRGVHSAASLGTSYGGVTLPAAGNYTFEIPTPGIILYGNDPSGRPGLAVGTDTANEPIRVLFFAREWPLPG